MIYLTSDTNKGIFWKRFHDTKLDSRDLLIVLGDTGMDISQGFESNYKREWFETRDHITVVISKKENYEERIDCVCEDDEVETAFSRITNMHGGKIYILDDIRFLIINETTDLEALESIEADYVLATNFDLLEKIRNKITFKHAYVAECDELIVEDANVTILSEEIQAIK